MLIYIYIYIIYFMHFSVNGHDEFPFDLIDDMDTLSSYVSCHIGLFMKNCTHVYLIMKAS